MDLKKYIEEFEFIFFNLKIENKNIVLYNYLQELESS
jgi:hypothetical protein